LNGTAASDLIWINVVREPIPRWSSLFYYAVDVSLRGERAATELATRAKDTRCGCAGLEFYECIEMRHHHNCSLKLPSQITSFCEPREACSRELATARVHASYRLVGLTEELEITLKVLEKSTYTASFCKLPSCCASTDFDGPKSPWFSNLKWFVLWTKRPGWRA
jgi:hypothetical protein